MEDIASRGTFRSIEVDDADLAQLLNVEKDTETETGTGTAQMQCDNQDTNDQISTQGYCLVKLEVLYL